MKKIKLNKLSILSITLLAISIIYLLFIYFNKAKDIEITTNLVLVLSLGFLISLISMITAIISRSQIKKNKEHGRIIIFFCMAISIMMVLQFERLLFPSISMLNVKNNDKRVCDTVKYCIKEGNNISKCETVIYTKNIKLKCTTSLLKEEQFK